MSQPITQPIQKRLLSWVAIGLAWLALGAPLAALHPNQPQGFDPERAYQLTPEVDQVDLYSGRLSARIPIGPFALYYNGNVWRYSEDDDGNVVAQPDRITTAGLGWHLGWGEIYAPGHWVNPGNQWLYVGDDGGRHFFHNTLHYDDGNATANVFYTRDGSYLRMRIDPAGSCWAEIEFPDGQTRRFGRSSCGPSTPLRWTYSWDRFGSLADPDLTITYNTGDTERTVTDRYGRTHVIHLTDQYAWMLRTVTAIDLESVGGQRAVYTLSYDDVLVDRSCKDQSNTTPTRVRLPHLKRVEMPQPDGSAYSMVDGGALQYRNTCDTIDDSPGLLTGMVLPTGGKLEWEYQEFEFPPGTSNSVFNSAAGVSRRRVLDANGVEEGSWIYTTTQIPPQNGNDPEMHTEVVVLPEGDCTYHYFNAIYYLDVQPVQKGWETGLPFTYTAQSGGRYLSSEVWTGHDGQNHCSGTKLRSTYVKYRHDTLPGNASNPIEWRESNRQIEAQRTVFHDDGERYIDVESSEFDGLGQFRRTVVRGDLSGSPLLDERETRIGFNRSTGVYPGSYVPVPPSSPWIIGTYDSVQVTELGAEGEAVSRLETQFHPVTGALECSRRLASGSSQGANDLLTRFLYDARGQVTDLKQYGGDLDPIGVDQAGGDCGAVLGAPVYWTHRHYEHGVLEWERPRSPDGTDGPYRSYDVDLDPSTGAVLRERDPSGFETVHSYDVLGRRVSSTPQNGASTHTTYTAAGSGSPATVEIETRAASGGAPLTRVEVELDGLGRAHRQRVMMPSGQWSESVTTYNPRGWPLTVSEPGDPLTVTQYLGYDPWGRPATVRPPEGSAHDVTLSYLGERQVTHTVRIATTLGGAETPFSTVRRFDSHGRLRQVLEPSAPSNANTSTSFGYDVGNRTTRISAGPQGQSQFRLFTYDNRGFLLSEQHPETGTVSYQDYDASGRVHRRTDGANDLLFTYDDFGRTLQVRDLGHGSRLVKSYLYDGAPGLGLGKLWKATRHNYLELPWTSPGLDDVVITDQYSYHGVGGARSQIDTLFYWGDGMDRFRQWMVYDDLGNLASYTYPRVVPGGSSPTGDTSRTVQFTYDEGRLVEIPGWVSSLEYHPSGVWSRISHTNGVDHQRDLDPDHQTRSRRLYTTGVAPTSGNYDSGLFAYDGAGNIEAIGNERYRYDGVGRLVEASTAFGLVSQSYAYDRFGNLTGRTTDGVVETFAVDTGSNRLSTATYDGAGNLTHYDGRTFAYDTSNRVIEQGWMRYLYNANDERLASIPNVPQRVVRYHLRDDDHRRASEFELAGGALDRVRDWVYAGSMLVASDSPSGERYHYAADHLGTPRVISDGKGNEVSQQVLLPFGEEFTSSIVDNVKLAGHERDASYGTDAMHERHYASWIGRFLSVDPVRGSRSRPQSLNRYTYARNNPIRFIDPDGRDSEEGEGKGEEENQLTVVDGGEITVTGGYIPWNFHNRVPFAFPPERFGGVTYNGPTETGGIGGGGSGGGIESGGPETGSGGTEGGEGEGEGEEEETEPKCKLKLRPYVSVGGGKGWWAGAAGWANLGLPGHVSTTTVGGHGFMVPGVHTNVGLKLSRGKVIGKGMGGILSFGSVGDLTIKWVTGANGAWEVAIGIGGGTPHFGYVAGPSYSTYNALGLNQPPKNCY